MLLIDDIGIKDFGELSLLEIKELYDDIYGKFSFTAEKTFMNEVYRYNIQTPWGGFISSEPGDDLRNWIISHPFCYDGMYGHKKIPAGIKYGDMRDNIKKTWLRYRVKIEVFRANDAWFNYNVWIDDLLLCDAAYVNKCPTEKVLVAICAAHKSRFP